MKIDNKIFWIYSINNAVDSALKSLNQEDEKEVFYRVGTALHWAVDCYERIEKISKLPKERIQLLSALRCANNALKHSVNLIELHISRYGMGFPFSFPLGFKKTYSWKDLSSVDIRHQSQKENYEKLLMGNDIAVSLEFIKKDLNNILEEC